MLVGGALGDVGAAAMDPAPGEEPLPGGPVSAEDVTVSAEAGGEPVATVADAGDAAPAAAGSQEHLRGRDEVQVVQPRVDLTTSESTKSDWSEGAPLEAQPCGGRCEDNPRCQRCCAKHKQCCMNCLYDPTGVKSLTFGGFYWRRDTVLIFVACLFIGCVFGDFLLATSIPHILRQAKKTARAMSTFADISEDLLNLHEEYATEAETARPPASLF